MGTSQDLAVKEVRESMDWVEIAAGSALLVGGLLMLAGKRRAGTVLAASGGALTLLDQQEAVRKWWNRLPGYIEEVQRVADQVQEVAEDLAVKREKLRTLLHPQE